MADAQIHLRRESKDWAERFRSYRILLDGTRVGSIKRGQTVSLQSEAGHHTLQVAIDWGKSPVIELSLAPGEERTLRCWSNANPLTGLYWITLGRKRYLGLE
jgi:hypothetical protein